VVLALAVHWDSSIRVLHLFESFPYLMSSSFLFAQSQIWLRWGFATGAFWLWIAGTLTTFVRSFERLTMLVTTGHVDRQDMWIARTS
jgi:hypothetical protein